jgi:hypothetical protein
MHVGVCHVIGSVKIGKRPTRAKNTAARLNRAVTVAASSLYSKRPAQVLASSRLCATSMSPSEVVQENVFPLDAKVQQHINDRGIHHGRTTHVVLTVFRCRMILEVLLIKHIVNESREPIPIVLRLWV